MKVEYIYAWRYTTAHSNLFDVAIVISTIAYPQYLSTLNTQMVLALFLDLIKHISLLDWPGSFSILLLKHI